MTFEPGATILVREVLHGQVWLEFPERVVADDGVVLASVQELGSPLTHHPEHPFGPHPWSHVAVWGDTTVLKLRRAGEWYSVWRVFGADAVFRHWYVNFERPLTRRPDGVDIDDLQLDLVVEPDGARCWKDVEDLAPALASGRMAREHVRPVLDAAARVSDLLDRDERWWAPWDSWRPDHPHGVGQSGP